MKLSFYTVNDLRLGYDPQGENGWRQSRFLDWRDALTQYRSLPDDTVKVFGLSNSEQDVELIRHVPTDANDSVWENVLTLDFLTLPLWKKEEGVISLATELVPQLDIRYCLTVDKLVPAPIGPFASRQNLKGIYLWPDVPSIPESAIRWIYLADVGWVPPKELQRRFPSPEQTCHYPVVFKYQVDGMTEKGSYTPLEVSYWEYKMLEHRTQERLNHNKKQEE